MTQFTRRVAAAGAAALALAVTTGAGGTAVAADEPTNPSYITSWVALTTGASNTVKLVTPATTPVVTKTQTLTTGKACAMATSGDNVLSFSSVPTSPGVGLASGSIGVREKNTSSGTSCSAVDTAANETLNLDLGSVVGTSVATSASLDIDLKQSAQIVATAKLDDAVVGSFELRSGTSIANPVIVGTPTAVQPCNNPADSGPDSGVNNNCRWNISVPSWDGADDGIVFDRLELKAVKGSFSLMGGADGPYAALPTYFAPYRNSSVLEIADGALNCGDTATLKGVVASQWKRLGNADGGACLPFPYTSSSVKEADGKYFVQFTKPLDAQTKAQALWTTTFLVGAGNTVPPISVELDVAGSTDKILFDPLLACSSSYYNADGTFKAPTTAPSGPTACLVSAVRGSGKLNKYVTYTAYVYGDAGMRN